MSSELHTPERRVCERCGRCETWNGEISSWQVEPGEVGDTYCIHEWDIDGDGGFAPVQE
jgi:hypothetical protein